VRRIAALLLFFVCADVAAATSVHLTRDAAPFAGGEVCRFAARDGENPFRRWLASQELTCVAAGSLTFPPGLWNVFARADGVLSPVTLIDGAAAPAAIALPLAPAATLVPLLPAGRGGIVYTTRSGSAFPIAAGTQSLSVPAGEPLWLIVIDRSTPAAVFTTPAIEAHGQRSLDARGGGGSAVMTWISVPESDRKAIAAAHNIASPHVAIKGGDESEPLPPPETMHGAFVLLRGIATAGEKQLELSGRSWLPSSEKVKVAAQPVTISEQPLVAHGASTVIVNWSANDGIVELSRDIPDCDSANAKPPQFELSLLSCPSPQPPERTVDSASCQVIRHETLATDRLYGTFTLDGVPPATYRAELKFGNLPPIETGVVALPFEIQNLRLVAGYDQVYGDVTFGGEPLSKDATIGFAGNGHGFAHREKSNYRAALDHMLATDDVINIAACDDPLRAFVVVDRYAPRSQRFDIEIPDNELTLTITDTFTQIAIPGATVRYSVMSKLLPRRPVVTRTVSAKGEESSVVIRSLPERELRITVSAPGYQKQDLEPFSLTKSEHRKLEVKMMPLRGSRGLIVSPTAFDNASILWFSPSGTEIEHAEVSSDGTFVYAREHQGDETLAVVSQSHPLWVLRSPAVARGATMTLQFPNAQRRSFEVALHGGNSTDNHYIAIVVGGVRVPAPAFSQHAILRRMQTVVRNVRPLAVSDIAQTGPIQIILGPTTDELLSRWLGTDFFALPQFAGAPREPLAPGAESVTFELP
jgi:hypothetical protein